MVSYSDATNEELLNELEELRRQYARYKADIIRLDMTRGKPSADQLELSEKMLGIIQTNADCFDDNGLDCRNYGLLDGIPEAKVLFADVLGVRPEQVILGGNSSLNMMFDTFGRAFCFGNLNSLKPWSQEKKVKFLCPAPGYDRHFAICQQFNIQMIPVPMLADGPDMDLIEKLVSEDASVKGIWCVPKYSNPTGTVYSDEVVRRFAHLKPKACDFRIFWDNAYAVHDLYEEAPQILNILDECEKAGNPNMAYMFSSTSKITYPGSGVAVLAASVDNIEHIKKQIGVQTIGPDKLNQLRHVRMFKNKDMLLQQMKKHADILRPKFETVLHILERDLGGKGIAKWSKPLGGYFVSVDALPGCAKRIYHLCDEAGVSLTMVGATFPYGNDPEDSNIRLAPSYPPVSELKIAMERFTVCVRIAGIEKILADREISAC
ncbi:MAG: aminotransferase class I/II-fold pyridoxal phosphate-dependent enzyme [Clostridia bacterium]|nr:aminotransferase class I/II-fold pyridoxal phosphate-dependent enzyme [Clostridia bacterium]